MPRAFSSGALSIWSNATCCARPCAAWIDVIAAVSVGLAVIDVTDRADVHVRLRALELCLGHCPIS
jgi:hypothetical protein